MNSKKINTFMNMAESIAKLSPDTQTQVGSIAVHPESYDCVLPSFNGFVAKTKAKLPTIRPDKSSR